MKKESTFYHSFLFFLLFCITHFSAVSGGVGSRKLLNFPDMPWGPNGGGSGNQIGRYGSAHGPNWDYNWGWGSSPVSGWGYGYGSSRSRTGFGKGYGFGYGSGSGSGSGYGYGSGGGGYGGSGDHGYDGSGGSEYHLPITTSDKNKNG